MGLRKEIKVLRKKTTVVLEEGTIYYQTLGLPGILAILANLVCAHPEHVTISTNGIKHPLFVRLRTSDAVIFRDVFFEREYYYQTSFSPRTIIDVGANCGMTSVFYANLYPEAAIVALEPEASNFAALVRNTRAYPNITPIHAALWSSDGQVEVFPPWPRWRTWGKWGFRVRKGNGCRALTMRTLMREVEMETVDILKIDVEGAEREIFSSCDWIDNVKLLAIELHDRDCPGCSDAVNAITRQYHKTERGPVTFYAR